MNDYRQSNTGTLAPPAAEVEAKPRSTEEIEVSFVMPCLNEAETLEGSIKMAQRCIAENNLKAEIVISDNGSTDGSQEIARRNGARVVNAPEKGYGNALRFGFANARGKYLIMGDSDQSYDFGDCMKFIRKLREGADICMGTRFGPGAHIVRSAMPVTHRYFGNPTLSFIGRMLFNVPARDFYCGLRAFTREAYDRMDLRTTGMEFAMEIVIKSAMKGMKFAQVPITLHKDGRSRPPHLRSFRDGWRGLRFMMTLSPRWTLLIPGIVLMAIGLLIGVPLALGMTVKIGPAVLGVHTLLSASLALIVGYMWVTSAIAMRIFGLTSEIGLPSSRVQNLFKTFTLERGLIAGGLATLIGVAIIAWLTIAWARAGFGELDPNSTFRPMIVAFTLVATGVITVLMSFIYSMMSIKHTTKVMR